MRKVRITNFVDAIWLCKMAESEGDKKWTYNLTKLLINTRLEREADFNGKKKKKAVLWGRVLQQIQAVEPNFKFSRDDITKKFLNLMVTYRRIKKRNNTSGEAARTWEFLDCFDEVFGTRADITVPDNFLESSLRESVFDDDNGTDRTPPPKKLKRDFVELLTQECEADRKFMNEFLECEKERIKVEGEKVEEMRKLREAMLNVTKIL